MANYTTPDATQGLAPDGQAFAPTELIPEALILQTSTKVGSLEGDERSVNVPYLEVDDDPAFVVEGATISDGAPSTTDVTIATGKIALLEPISRELWSRGGVSNLLSKAAKRALIKKANIAYLTQAAPTGDSPPAGLFNLSPTDGGTVATDLDVLNDAVLDIEAAWGQASHILASPTAYKSLSSFKTATGSNTNLLGAGVEASERRLANLPVIVSPAVTANKVLILDKGSVLSVYGPIMLAISTESHFTSDSVALRLTWRFGQAIANTARVIELTVTAPA